MESSKQGINHTVYGNLLNYFNSKQVRQIHIIKKKKQSTNDRQYSSNQF